MKKSTGTDKPKSTLKDLSTWLLWQLKPAKPGKKPLKIPYYTNGRTRGETDTVDDLSQLVTYKEAVAAAKGLNNGGGKVRDLKWRVGLAITDGLVFIDLDGHRDPDTGEPDNFAQAWLKDCQGAIVEVSQSGRGYHIIGAYPGTPISHVDHETGVEIYTYGRFCAWTGDLVGAGALVDLTGVVDEVSDDFRERQPRVDTKQFSGPRWDNYNTNEAITQLQKRNPDCSYPDWRDVAFALHDGTHGDGDGLDLFIAWSQGSFWPTDAAKFDEGACRKLWHSIKPGRGITKASLFVEPVKPRKKPGEPPIRKPKPAPPEPSARQEVTPAPRTAMVPIVPPEPSGEAGPFTSGLVLRDLAPKAIIWPVTEIFSTGAALLVARPKGGKTFLCTQLAHALSTGGTFLGKPCLQGRTLYIAAEDTLDSFRHRMVETLRLAPTGQLSIVDAEGLAKEAGEYEDTTLDAWIEHCIITYKFKNVIIDTHASAEAIWSGEQLTDARKYSPVEVAYQKTRVFENIAQRHNGLTVLVHHTRKRNGKEITDFHELINLPQTVVAGCSTSLVLADHPERSAYDDEDGRRVLARRGRQGSEFILALSFTSDGLENMGSYSVVEQTEKQSELLSVVEALQEGGEFVSVIDVASELGKHRRTIDALITRMKRAKNWVWKNKRVETKPGRGGGIRLVPIS